MVALSKKSKALLDSMEKDLQDGDTFGSAVMRIASELDAVKDVKEMGDAVKALEAKIANEHAEQLKDMESRIKKAEARVYNNVGQYRGAFPNEDSARAFGLFIIAKTTQADWAADALKSEHKSLYNSLANNRAFTTTTADAVIPEVWLQVMENLLEDHGVFERDALNVPMTGDLVHYSKKTGRVAAVPMSEGGALGAAEPSIEGRQLTARKWGAYSEINNEALEDAAIAIAEFVAMDMVEAHALAADQAGFLGDGTGTYNQITGVINALNAGAIIDAGANDWTGYTEANLRKGVSKCVTKTFTGVGQAKWYCTHAFFWDVLAGIQIAAGGNTVADLGRGPVMQCLGFKVELAQVLPSTPAGNQIPLVFGNLRRGAAFGNRRALSVKQDASYRFANDQLAMLSTRRMDIDVHATGDVTKAETLVGFQTAA